MTAEAESQPHGNLLAWLQLMRVSALPTAVSNILAGFLLSNQSWLPLVPLILLVTSSACLYISGMILNDYCDREIDSKDRPSRPLPSGRIRPNRAFNAYVFLSIAGIALACGTGACSAIIAIALVVMIYLYNKALKKTPVAPIAMGSCRFLNILLGASYVANDSAELISFPPVSIWVAASIGTFICGLTWFARNEASKSRQSNLILSTLLITVGILVLASTGYVFSLANPIGIAVLIIAVSIPAMYRVSAATAAPTALKVQQAVRALIQSLILFDAAVCILAVPGNPAFAMATLALLIPAMYLARFISST